MFLFPRQFPTVKIRKTLRVAFPLAKLTKYVNCIDRQEGTTTSAFVLIDPPPKIFNRLGSQRYMGLERREVK